MAKVIGHKKPDTDSICSAIVFADYLKLKNNIDAEVCRLGEINLETEYILETLEVPKPKLIDKVEKGEELYLIDHNEATQSVDNRDEAEIKMVVDHHRIANFQTEAPLEMRVLPVGCSSTVLYTMYQENNLEIKPEIAKLMISAIISDTLLFKSPTTTEFDKGAVKKLNEIAKLNIEEYGMSLLKAGTNLDSKTSKELLEIDAKEFMVENYKYEVAQVNTADINEILEKREEELKNEISNNIKEKKLGLFILMITDIINNNSMLLVQGQNSNKFEEKFDVKLKDNKILLEGVVSRKKQIVPFL